MHKNITVFLPEYHIEVSLLLKANLTLTEVMLFKFLLQGKSIPDIATYRRRSPKTISAQKLQLYKKLGIKNDVMFWREVIFKCQPTINYLPNYKYKNL